MVHILTAIANKFFDIAQDVLLRIRLFGTCTMNRFGCKIMDSLLPFLACERIFLESTGRAVSDNKLVHTLQAELSCKRQDLQSMWEENALQASSY